MALKVIGAGFGRTGTMSMKAALQKLGYNKCHHMLEVMPSAKQVDLWHAISQGGAPDWDAIFKGFQASVDFPSSVFYKQLADYYPDAKIVLTVRDFDKWYESASDTIYEISQVFPAWTQLLPRPRKIKEMADGIIWDTLFDGRFEDRAHTEKVYNDHIAAVKAAIPPERLLVIEVKEGWEPLCKFLDHDVPDEPFPRVNDTAEFMKRIRFVKRLAYVPWIAAGLVALAAYLLFQ